MAAYPVRMASTARRPQPSTYHRHISQPRRERARPADPATAAAPSSSPRLQLPIRRRYGWKRPSRRREPADQVPSDRATLAPPPGAAADAAPHQSAPLRRVIDIQKSKLEICRYLPRPRNVGRGLCSRYVPWAACILDHLNRVASLRVRQARRFKKLLDDRI